MKLTPFANAFRPFFGLGALWSAAALLVWMGPLRHGAGLPTAFGPMAWHAHAMIHGFGMAIVAGFVFVQLPVLQALGIDVEDFSTKDHLYVLFMTFSMWFVTWTILLTNGITF